MDRACIECGAKIARGLRCRSHAARERWRLKYSPRYCKTCCGEITGRNKARAVYCSVACKFADPEVRAKIGPPLKRVNKVCPHCGTAFDVPVSMDRRYNYCSKACSMDARGRAAVCKRCGAAFRHGQGENRSYCCETCRRPPVMITCELCGTIFRTTPSSAVGRRYCSPHCYMASGLETSIERTVRELLEARCLVFRAQASIGPWTVDFLIDERIVIEADGSYWHTLRPHVDRRKTADLTSRGYAVWRIPETEIRDSQFALLLERRLVNEEAASGKLTRRAPDVDAVLDD